MEVNMRENLSGRDCISFVVVFWFFLIERACGFVTVECLKARTMKIIFVHKLHEGRSQR